MQITQFNRYSSAAAFAMAGEHQTARQMVGGGSALKPAAKPHKKKPYLGAMVFGAISITFYVLLLKNEGLVTDIFTRGGWATIYPVGTAFVFSFIHGAFASNLLSCLGLEAKK